MLHRRPTLLAPAWLLLAAGCSQSSANEPDADATAGPAAAGAARRPAPADPAPIVPAQPVPRPDAPQGAMNVVLITIDTLRADHLGCYGYDRPTSPNLDRFAAEATLFETCLVQWPKTGPSMASLLSSTYGSTSGVMRETLKVPVPLHYDLFTEVMQRSGWGTYGVVSNISLSEKFHYDQGFDRFFVHAGDLCRGDRVTSRALELLDGRDPARPFFLWAHYLDPHAPYQPMKKLLAPFLADEKWRAGDGPVLAVDPRVDDPEAAKPEHNDIGMIPEYAHFKPKYHWVEGEERRKLRSYVAGYDGDIRFLDEQVGALLDRLLNDGLLRNSIVVVTADHGESLGEHDYYFEHGRFPYDDCVHVPLIVFHPDWVRGRRVEAPVALLDVMPTLVELLGVEPGWQFEGASLLPWLEAGADAATARPVFTESGYEARYDISIRRGRWKLILIGSREQAALLTGSQYELYDLEADPDETRNLVEHEPDVFETLRTELDAYAEAAFAKMPATTATPQLSAEEQAEMDALGYGRGGGATSPGDGR